MDKINTAKILFSILACLFGSVLVLMFSFINVEMFTFVNLLLYVLEDYELLYVFINFICSSFIVVFLIYKNNLYMLLSIFLVVLLLFLDIMPVMIGIIYFLKYEYLEIPWTLILLIIHAYLLCQLLKLK